MDTRTYARTTDSDAALLSDSTQERQLLGRLQARGRAMNNDRSEDQVDVDAKRGAPKLPDRSGRLTGHTKQPLKGTDPKSVDDAQNKPAEPESKD